MIMVRRFHFTNAETTLKIHYADGPKEGVIFYISKNLGGVVANKARYLARREGTPYVFEITPLFIDYLKNRP